MLFASGSKPEKTLVGRTFGLATKKWKVQVPWVKFDRKRKEKINELETWFVWCFFFCEGKVRGKQKKDRQNNTGHFADHSASVKPK